MFSGLVLALVATFTPGHDVRPCPLVGHQALLRREFGSETDDTGSHRIERVQLEVDRFTVLTVEARYCERPRAALEAKDLACPPPPSPISCEGAEVRVNGADGLSFGVKAGEGKPALALRPGLEDELRALIREPRASEAARVQALARAMDWLHWPYPLDWDRIGRLQRLVDLARASLLLDSHALRAASQLLQCTHGLAYGHKDRIPEEVPVCARFSSERAATFPLRLGAPRTLLRVEDAAASPDGRWIALLVRNECGRELRVQSTRAPWVRSRCLRPGQRGVSNAGAAQEPASPKRELRSARSPSEATPNQAKL